MHATATPAARGTLRWAALVVALLAVAGGCGDDEDLPELTHEWEPLPESAVKDIDLSGSTWGLRLRQKQAMPKGERAVEWIGLKIRNDSDFTVNEMKLRVVIEDPNGGVALDQVHSLSDPAGLVAPESTNERMLDVGVALKEGQRFRVEVVSATGND